MKTKTFVKWTVAIVAVSLVALATAVRAQTNLSFLVSKAALRAYAVEQAKTASFSLSSQSQVGNQTTTGTILPMNHVSADIINAVSQSGSITVLNLKDWVYREAFAVNSDGDMLLYGYSSTLPVFGKGGYYLPTNSVTLVLNSQIPVKFAKQVSYAEIEYTDPTTGQTYSYQEVHPLATRSIFRRVRRAMDSCKSTSPMALKPTMTSAMGAS